jgi:hypothetical protein
MRFKNPETILQDSNERIALIFKTNNFLLEYQMSPYQLQKVANQIPQANEIYRNLISSELKILENILHENMGDKTCQE